MDSCSREVTGDSASLTVPSTLAYGGLVLDFCEGMARLAGFGPHGAGRCRLTAEEIFDHIAQECVQSGRREQCRLELEVIAEGLSICFITDHLTYDPQNTPEYSLGAVLEGGEPQGLGLHLVKQYAQSITLTRKGQERRLCLVMARDSLDQGARPWSRLVPSLAAGVSLKPVERDGKLIYKLDDSARGKSYQARALAHQVLTLVDGRQSFGRIMAQTLKVMPEVGSHQVEDLFQVLIQRGLVITQELPRPQAEIEVRDQLEVRTLQAMSAYKKASEEGPA
ncbi:MAG: ATP-binding protein [Desulfarculus sp.]|nr:ATP-binding protein [Desulfarculus sp.]